MTLEAKHGLEALLGTWHGEGKGMFPGIEDFNYREELSFEAITGRQEISCRQNTFKRLANGEEEASHLEVGLLYNDNDGRLVWHNVQSGGRIELMGHHPEEHEEKHRWRFLSERFFNDPKAHYAVASERVLRVRENVLTYRVYMATRVQNKALLHLEATLERV